MEQVSRCCTVMNITDQFGHAVGAILRFKSRRKIYNCFFQGIIMVYQFFQVISAFNYVYDSAEG